MFVRVYELMIIIDRDVDEAGVKAVVERVGALVGEADATIATTDEWGVRRFAYEIEHKNEGQYVVFEILAEAGALDELDRYLRVADESVRHKLIHIPDDEAERRGLIGDGSPAVEPSAPATPVEAG